MQDILENIPIEYNTDEEKFEDQDRSADFHSGEIEFDNSIIKTEDGYMENEVEQGGLFIILAKSRFSPLLKITKTAICIERFKHFEMIRIFR